MEDTDQRWALHTVVNIEESDSGSESDLIESYFSTSSYEKKGLPNRFLLKSKRN